MNARLPTSNTAAASLDRHVEVVGVGILLRKLIAPQGVSPIPDAQPNANGRHGDDGEAAVATWPRVSSLSLTAG